MKTLLKYQTTLGKEEIKVDLSVVNVNERRIRQFFAAAAASERGREGQIGIELVAVGVGVGRGRHPHVSGAVVHLFEWRQLLSIAMQRLLESSFSVDG